MKGGENMLKIMNPYQQQAIDNESVAFRDIVPMSPCVCNSQLANYSSTRNSGPGCRCSCIGTVNAQANREAARN
jgi:hypothetical protein